LKTFYNWQAKYISTTVIEFPTKNVLSFRWSSSIFRFLWSYEVE